MEPQQRAAAAGPHVHRGAGHSAVPQAHEQILVTDRDFIASMRQHGLDWIADAIFPSRSKSKPKPKPARPLQPVVRVPNKRGPKKGTKYRPRQKKLAGTSGASSAQGARPAEALESATARAGEDAGRQVVPQGDNVNEVNDLAWETNVGGSDSLELGGEADHVLHELIDMYESQHGQLPTEDAIRSWMTTLQEATATSALASGVLGPAEVVTEDKEGTGAV
eukprot:COSAG02_NODE_359_length_23842_cov_22.550011_6_plen_221_part_00